MKTLAAKAYAKGKKKTAGSVTIQKGKATGLSQKKTSGRISRTKPAVVARIPDASPTSHVVIEKGPGIDREVVTLEMIHLGTEAMKAVGFSTQKTPPDFYSAFTVAIAWMREHRARIDRAWGSLDDGSPIILIIGSSKEYDFGMLGELGEALMDINTRLLDSPFVVGLRYIPHVPEGAEEGMLDPSHKWLIPLDEAK